LIETYTVCCDFCCREGLDDSIFDGLMKPHKRLGDLLSELVERVLPAQPGQVDSLAYLRNQSEVFGPGRVNVTERDGAFGLARDFFSETIAQFGVTFWEPLGAQSRLSGASQRGHAPLLHSAALPFDQ
jgi:hypothetical protein